MTDQSQPQEHANKAAGQKLVVHEYALGRLYDKVAGACVAPGDLAAMARAGVEVVVYDAKTDEDVMRKVLTR